MSHHSAGPAGPLPAEKEHVTATVLAEVEQLLEGWQVEGMSGSWSAWKGEHWARAETLAGLVYKIKHEDFESISNYGYVVLNEHRRERIDPDFSGERPELEWSIESGASYKEDKPIRLIISSDEGAIHIEDVRTTSHEASFELVRDDSYNRIGLTRSEARWVLARLPAVLKRAEEDWEE